ncbi:hypothetical protein [Desulfovibrio oxyclinae]|uniref:flagellin N-terminal helical domain-containing protein n=1 Tax=Desulfovibrio oxyclinae TaxID=63560 RepID=UPI000379CEC5|nr:hypothetical protein [Desulfovibrio oxyclinae]
MRISQQMLFSRYTGNMGSSLEQLVDVNIRAQNMKKVVRPSDDPTGMIRILDHRDTLRSLDQYSENISTAKGWLTSSDGTLQQVSTLLTRAKELAEQAASGHMSADNREQVSYELRSLFDQFLGLANSTFEGQSLFAGQKTEGKAFEEIMWMTTNDRSFNETTNFTINGKSDSTVLVQFYQNGASGGTASMSGSQVRYSIDGGDTWLDDGSITGGAGNPQTLQLPQSGTSVELDGDPTVNLTDENDYNDSDGTWLWLRQSARYLGDDNDRVAPNGNSRIEVDTISPGAVNVDPVAAGRFDRENVMVRIDNDAAVGLDEEIEYSYSLNGGITWNTGNTVAPDTTASNAVLSIEPVGTLTLNSNGGGGLVDPGTQFMIKPRTADIALDISSTEQVRLNEVGKDVFGGIYQDPDVQNSNGGNYVRVGSANSSPSLTLLNSNGRPVNMAGTLLDSESKETTSNLFETMGNLIAFCETNNQSGVQQSLANLETTHEHIMNSLASVGGRENRLQVAESILSNLNVNERDLLSSIEDADVGDLMTELKQKQMLYESVLRTAATVMNTNLTKFI